MPMFVAQGPMQLPTGTVNFVLKSQSINTIPPWAIQASTITEDSTTAPDSSTTADTYRADANGGFGSFLIQDITPAGSQFTLSFYAKPTGVAGQWLAASISDTTFSVHHFAWFDYLNNVLGSTDAGVTSGKTDIGGAGGWNRYYLTFTTANAVSGIVFMLVTADGSTATVLGTEVFFWGFQLEAGGTTTTYSPNL